jgi:hypothetical protein
MRALVAIAMLALISVPAAAQSTDDRYANVRGAVQGAPNAVGGYRGVRKGRIARAGRYGRFTCGITMMRMTGQTDPRLALARSWLKFPRTSAGPGAVVVQGRAGRALGGGPGGHVSRIVELRGSCRALVQDNRGTYERDICRRLLGYVRA